MAEVGGRRLRLGTARSSPLLVLSIVGACATAPAVPYTLATSPLAFLPAAGAGIDDQRGRFREILCAVDEAHGHELPEYRPCDEILHRFTDEPAGTGEPVYLGPARSKLRLAVVAGLGAECFVGLVSAFQFALEHVQGLGYQTASIRVDGLSSSTNNGRQIRDAVVAMDLASDERLVLVGYSKGTPDADSCVDPPGCGTVAAFARSCVRFRKNFTLCVLASWLALSGIDAARAQEKTRHILVLHPYNTTVRVSALADDAMKRRLTERSREPLEFYTEFLDLGRFPGDEHEARMVRHLADKYRDRKPTVVLAMGPPSLRFLVQNRDILGYDAPVVFCCHSSATLATQSVPADATGIITEFDLTKTLALAQLLQPDARSIVVVSGADAFDRQWSRTARGQLAGYEGKYDVRYLEGLAYVRPAR